MPHSAQWPIHRAHFLVPGHTANRPPRRLLTQEQAAPPVGTRVPRPEQGSPCRSHPAPPWPGAPRPCPGAHRTRCPAHMQGTGRDAFTPSHNITLIPFWKAILISSHRQQRGDPEAKSDGPLQTAPGLTLSPNGLSSSCEAPNLRQQRQESQPQRADKEVVGSGCSVFSS